MRCFLCFCRCLGSAPLRLCARIVFGWSFFARSREVLGFEILILEVLVIPFALDDRF